MPTLGLEYEDWFGHKFALGLYNDVELGEYIINTEQREDLNRITLLSRRPLASGSRSGAWILCRPRHRNRGPREFLRHQGWDGVQLSAGQLVGGDLAVSLIYDWKDVYGAWSLGVSAGKRFGPTVMK